MAGNICRQYINADLGLGSDAKANAIRAEGLTTLDDFADFDNDGIKTLCKSVRCQGGTIPNPLYQDHWPGHARFT